MRWGISLHFSKWLTISLFFILLSLFQNCGPGALRSGEIQVSDSNLSPEALTEPSPPLVEPAPTDGSQPTETENVIAGEGFLREVIVENAQELTDALDNSQPGDLILLTGNSYNGFQIENSGTPQNLIVIKAEEKLAPKIAGNITINGDFVWVVGLDLIDGGGVRIHGADDRISSSRFRSRGNSIYVADEARRATIDHNEIDSQALPSSTAWKGVDLQYNSPRVEHHVFRNHLYGAPRDDDDGDDNNAIACGGRGRRNSHHFAGNIIEHNLIEDWYGDAEVLMAKAVGCTFRYNTIINSRELDVRYGNQNQFISNWCENMDAIRIHGMDNQVIGNRCDIRIMGGNETPDISVEDQVGHTAAWNTLIAGNIGTLTIGSTFQGHELPSLNTKVEAHQGPIVREIEMGTTILENTNQTITPARKLQANEVGPGAPTAPR